MFYTQRRADLDGPGDHRYGHSLDVRSLCWQFAAAPSAAHTGDIVDPPSISRGERGVPHIVLYLRRAADATSLLGCHRSDESSGADRNDALLGQRASPTGGAAIVGSIGLLCQHE